MRVLFVTPYLPTLTKPRPHHFILALARRGHDVSVVALAEPELLRRAEDQPGWVDVLRHAEVTIVEHHRGSSYLRCTRALAGRTALRVAYCAVPHLLGAVEAAAERHAPDVVHVDRERLGPTLASLALPKILDATDSISTYNAHVVRHGRGLERFTALVDLPRMRRTEARMGDGYAAVLVAAHQDGEVMAGVSNTPVVTVPNGVTPAFFAAARRPVPDRITFVGNLSYPPNVDGVRWFANRILPMVAERRPAAHLHLVGAGPAPAVQALARRDPRVVLVGPVPDVVPHLAEASTAIAPMRIGGGFPNKVAEALAAGAPLVSTPEGCAGIPGLRDHVHLRVAAGEPAFAQAVVEQLAGGPSPAAMAARGRAHVAEHYRWDAIADALEAVYRQALTAPAR